MTGITGVTLDAAGTLIQVQEPVGETYARLARDHGIPVDAQQISRAFRTVFPRMSPLAFGRTEPERLDRQERDWWKTLVRNCLGAQGQHPGFASYFDELYDYYAQPAAWRLYPEILHVLGELAAAGVAMAVVSNFDSRLHGILDGLGVHGRFVAVLCSSEAGAAKPDRRIFESACTVLARDPDQVLHTGDSRRADFQGAREAGLHALWLCREEPENRDAGSIQDLGILPTVVTAGA